MKTWVLITFFFTQEGIMHMPPVEFPSLESCEDGKTIMVRNMTKELGVPPGINWHTTCVMKDFNILEGGLAL